MRNGQEKCKCGEYLKNTYKVEIYKNPLLESAFIENKNQKRRDDYQLNPNILYCILGKCWLNDILRYILRTARTNNVLLHILRTVRTNDVLLYIFRTGCTNNALLYILRTGQSNNVLFYRYNLRVPRTQRSSGYEHVNRQKM